MNAQLNAAVAGLRAGLDAYREHVVLAQADPRFQAALERSAHAAGFTTPGELSLLYHLAIAADGPGRIVEIGSYAGRSTIVLAQAAIDTQREPVVAIDPHEVPPMGHTDQRDLHEEFLDNVERAGVGSYVTPVRDYSTNAAANYDGTPIRMHFVDAVHSREAVLEDVGRWAQWFTPDVIAVFDDYLTSPGVSQGIRELQEQGLLRRDGLTVGKMAAFGPPHLLAKAPAAPGGRALMRLKDDRRERLIRLAER